MHKAVDIVGEKRCASILGMFWRKVGKELWDILKGALAVGVTAGAMTFIQYLGAHIPDIAQMLALVGGGWAGVKYRV